MKTIDHDPGNIDKSVQKRRGKTKPVTKNLPVSARNQSLGSTVAVLLTKFNVSIALVQMLIQPIKQKALLCCWPTSSPVPGHTTQALYKVHRQTIWWDTSKQYRSNKLTLLLNTLFTLVLESDNRLLSPNFCFQLFNQCCWDTAFQTPTSIGRPWKRIVEWKYLQQLCIWPPLIPTTAV